MADETEAVKAMAQAVGLGAFDAQQIEELARATRLAQARRASLPVGLIGTCDEPAHVYSLDDGAAQ